MQKIYIKGRKNYFMKIGIDLGGSHIAIGVVNNEGKILEKVEKRLMTQEKKYIKETIEKYIRLFGSNNRFGD